MVRLRLDLAGALFIMVCLVWNCGCPYTMSARLPARVPSVYVRAFDNSTTEALIGHELTGYVKEQLLDRTAVAVQPVPGGGSELGGRIRGIGRDVISRTSAGETLSERITVSVDVRLRTAGGDDENFNVIGVAVHERTDITSHAVLVQRALQDAARRITDHLLAAGPGND